MDNIEASVIAVGQDYKDAMLQQAMKDKNLGDIKLNSVEYERDILRQEKTIFTDIKDNALREDMINLGITATYLKELMEEQPGRVMKPNLDALNVAEFFRFVGTHTFKLQDLFFKVANRLQETGRKENGDLPSSQEADPEESGELVKEFFFQICLLRFFCQILLAPFCCFFFSDTAKFIRYYKKSQFVFSKFTPETIKEMLTADFVEARQSALDAQEKKEKKKISKKKTDDLPELAPQ
jgi:hypothetical protein